jgi:hypothetical protein
MISVYQGIEGDDIAWHLKLLGSDISQISKDVLFVPLNNHYGIQDADYIDQAIKQSSNYRAVVLYDLVNNGDYEHPRFSEFANNFPHTNKYWLTVNQAPIELTNIKIIHWDFMWNRYKAYYTETRPKGNIHHYAGKQAYQLPNVTVTHVKKKKLLSLCGREYGFRTHLYEFVKDLDCYASNRSKDICLEGTEVVGAFNPVPNEFYQNSCLSAYVESNCVRSDLIHVTEKTYEPLVKGHFILPFANPGSVKHIQTLGFKLPDFIDYSYDTEIDPFVRFTKYLEELKRLLDLDLFALHEQHTDMFVYNQQCLNTISYDCRLTEITGV